MKRIEFQRTLVGFSFAISIDFYLVYICYVILYLQIYPILKNILTIIHFIYMTFICRFTKFHYLHKFLYLTPLVAGYNKDYFRRCCRFKEIDFEIIWTAQTSVNMYKLVQRCTALYKFAKYLTNSYKLVHIWTYALERKKGLYWWLRYRFQYITELLANFKKLINLQIESLQREIIAIAPTDSGFL